MIEAINAALGGPGLWFAFVGATLAGLVRGFSGFGTAMVYLPFAAQVLPPVWVLITLVVMDLFGPLPAVPRALRDGQPREVLRLAAGALIGLPFGVAVLTQLPPEFFRYTVSLLSLVLVALLIAGIRYRGRLSAPLILGTGSASGFMAGAAGLPGPPAILFYMASPLPAAVIRANLMLFLVVTDIMMLGIFGATGLITAAPVIIGLLLVLPYLVAISLGSALFRPGYERLYRAVGYAIIAVSALSGLPLFD